MVLLKKLAKLTFKTDKIFKFSPDTLTKYSNRYFAIPFVNLAAHLPLETVGCPELLIWNARLPHCTRHRPVHI